LAAWQCRFDRFSGPGASLEFAGLLTQNASCSKKTEWAFLPFAHERFQDPRNEANMSIEIAEKLKAQLTDKYVVVKHGVAELKRFESLTGVVKTVNMSGRALVQFDGPVDISWYDIDPQYLSVVDAPVKKAAPEKHAPKEAAAKAAPAAPAAAKPVAAKPAGMSAIEMARAQGAGAAKPAAAKAPVAQAPAGAGTAPAAGAKLSALELARQQGAMKAGGAAPAAKPAPAPKAASPTTAPKADPQGAAAPTAAPAAGQPGKKMSPLEIARMQDAGKDSCLSAPTPAASAPAVAPPAAAPAAAPAPAAPAPAPPSGKKLSPLELARQQGAFKGNKG
jgi:hypothetical protein